MYSAIDAFILAIGNHCYNINYSARRAYEIPFEGNLVIIADTHIFNIGCSRISECRA